MSLVGMGSTVPISHRVGVTKHKTERSIGLLVCGSNTSPGNPSGLLALKHAPLCLLYMLGGQSAGNEAEAHHDLDYGWSSTRSTIYVHAVIDSATSYLALAIASC